MLDKKIRFVFMFLAGIMISYLLETLNTVADPGYNRLIDFFVAILITVLVWEGNLRIDSFMNRKFPWEKNPGKRVLFHLPAGIIYSAFVIYVSMLAFDEFVCAMPEHAQEGFMISAIVIGTLFSIILLSVEVSIQFFRNWKTSLVEVEKYKAESLQAQLQNLKDQLNPHFLFNNLSVLSSLVYKDQDKAVDFINQLSKVYRYLLDTGNKELVSLHDEIKIIASYTYLLQIRFDRNIVFNMDVPGDTGCFMIPAMSVQMLIENAVKHNEVSSDFPLTISIRILNERLEVTNNLQLRTASEPGSGKGLKNIKERYAYFTGEKVNISDAGKKFVVSIPLLKVK